jgi:hypothetical protein
MNCENEDIVMWLWDTLDTPYVKPENCKVKSVFMQNWFFHLSFLEDLGQFCFTNTK